MGIVIKQSFKNTVYTYLGFIIGAVNTLFLYTNFLTDEYYGLVGYILSAANIMTPVLSFGVQNTMVKFHSFYSDRNEMAKFNTMMFILPLFMIIPVAVIGILAHDTIAGFLSGTNEIIYDYVWLIFITAVVMAYFEVFFSWAKVHMRSVYGNFLKEVFHRVAVFILLFMVYFKWLTPQEFIVGLTVMYTLRMLLMGFSAWLIQKPQFKFALPFNYVNVLKYTTLIILAGSVAIILLDVDKFMIGQYKSLENIAFYNVAVFIALVINVPYRSMHQITYPLTARLMNEKNKEGLAALYKKSSLNLFIIGGIIFLLIIVNMNEMYRLLPGQYSGGLTVLFLISLAKLSECLLGNNNAILFNSDYYRMVLFFGVLLAVLTVLLNMIFIPLMGINGAAIATLIAFTVYNVIKISYVGKKMKMYPFSKETLLTLLLIAVLLPAFYFWDFNFHPVINIILKSGITGVIYLFMVLKFNLSDDVSDLITKLLKKKDPQL